MNRIIVLVSIISFALIAAGFNTAVSSFSAAASEPTGRLDSDPISPGENTNEKTRDLAPVGYYDVTITAASSNGSWSGGSPDVWTPTRNGSTVSAAEIRNRLEAGTSVVVTTAGGGSGNGDITLQDGISWNSDAVLTLTAYRNVAINCNIRAGGNSAGLTITPGNTGAGGGYSLGRGAIITLTGNAPTLNIQGNNYTVINEANGGITALQNINSNLSGRFALGSDVNASATSGWNGGTGFFPIGTYASGFSGTFDGLRHSINGIYINRQIAEPTGFFGLITSAGIVRNLGMVGGSVSGSTWDSNAAVGGLAGQNDGTISESYSSVNATCVRSFAGSFVGYNNGTISRSFATGNATVGEARGGGFAGQNAGTISDSYATGNVSGGCCANAGFTGHNIGTIRRSYSTGTAAGSFAIGGFVGEDWSGGGSVYQNNYWDTSTSGIGGSIGATGLTTAQMKQQASFANWDFTDVWSINEGTDYPRIRAFIGSCLVCAVPLKNLVHWLPGDGHSRDIRGSGNASLMNGATYVNGEVFTGFGFDGSNQYLSIPQATVLPVRGTSDFTIEAWISHQGDANNEAFNVFAYRNGGDDVQFLVTRTRIGIWATSAAGMIVLTNHGVNPATWNHYAFSRNGNTWRVYINGRQVGSDVSNGVNILTPTTPQNIGTTGLANTQFAKGAIDEIGIYDRALLGSEILSIYDAGVAGKCRTCTPAPVGLVAWWNGDGNSLDSRSRNDGLLFNSGFVTGFTGQAFSFLGTNDYLEIPNSGSLDLTGGLTLETWFLQRTAGFGTLFSKSDPNGSASVSSYGVQVNPDGSLNVALYGTYPADNWTTGPGLVTPGRWYHVAVTWDGLYANTNNVKLYLNGTLVQSWTKSPAPLNVTSQSVTIGSMKPPTYYGNLDGLIDEPTAYNRALSEAEIRAIADAGTAGKSKPSAVAPPSGLVGWWGGDGDAFDYSANGNHGTLLANGNYSIGKVGQSFIFRGTANSGVTINHSSDLNINPSGFTTEFWVKSTTPHSGLASLVDKSHGFTDSTGWVFSIGSGLARFAVGDTFAYFPEISSSAVVDDGNFHHIAGTVSGATMSLYVDGVFQSSRSITSPNNNTRPLLLGYAWGGGSPQRFFNGRIDEVSIYSRSLSPAEIQGVYLAGLAGKVRSVNTPANVFVERKPTDLQIDLDAPGFRLGDATVIMPTVSADGITLQTPIDPAKLPPLPNGLRTTGLTYDIATSAVWTGSVTVCFNLPSLTPDYPNLRILHLENGSWVDRTAIGGTSPILCTTALTSLSPFAIASLGPTAASVSISGRVLTENGSGIRNAVVQITDVQGNSRTVRTGSFGMYRFDDLQAGETYVISIASKRFNFAARTITASSDMYDVDLVAEVP